MPSIKAETIQELVDQQRQFINYFFDHLSLNQVEQALQVCLKCQGLLILTGVGKSGIIAEKVAMTMISTGTRALYLPAANFLHGDIGGITKDDVVIMFSKSGQTQELLALLPHMRRKKCKLISVISNLHSPLAAQGDCLVYLPVEKELCAFDLAPTTSTAAQLLFGDLLSIGLMKEKGFSLEEYAHNHPAGSIGKQLTLHVHDLMKTGLSLPLCLPDNRLVDVIVELSNKRCGCLLVVNEAQELLGIFTDGDLRRALQSRGGAAMDSSLGELMTLNPITVSPEDLAYEAIRKMQGTHYVMVAPVVKNKKVVGVIRMHDIIHEGLK